jgi:hypothetical protein
MGMTNTMRYWIAGAIVLLALIAGFLLYRGMSGAAVPGKTYESGIYGISFTYPETYTLQERDATDGKARHTITLIRSDELANIPEGGEGPTAMAFDFYPAKGLDTETWIQQTPSSNFGLSVDKEMHDATVGGAPAIAYTWDGLYRGNSFVFAHKGNIVVASVTYLTTDDRILRDFTGVLKSVRLE